MKLTTYQKRIIRRLPENKMAFSLALDIALEAVAWAEQAATLSALTSVDFAATASQKRSAEYSRRVALIASKQWA